MPRVVLVLHDIRSCHNVGSLLRSADGFGVKTVYFTGITPYPEVKNDVRLPHMRTKISKQISKTALGAEKTIDIQVVDSLSRLIDQLKSNHYTVAAVEQNKASKLLSAYHSPEKVALILGNEVDGLDNKYLSLCDVCLEIPMQGQKESFNVAVAGAIALYEITTTRD